MPYQGYHRATPLAFFLGFSARVNIVGDDAGFIENILMLLLSKRFGALAYGKDWWLHRMTGQG
jgi:hypothetical protein